MKALVNKDKKPKPFFALYSPQLSPALEIELISPLIMLSSRLDMHLDLTFSNLLFADIRLQKLLQEYFEVQERARRLLESKRVTSSPSFNKSRKIKTNSHRDEEKDRIKSIQEQKQALKNWKELETRSILSLLDNRQLNKRIDDSTLGDLVSLEKSLQGPNDFSRDISDLKKSIKEDRSLNEVVSLSKTQRVDIDSYKQDTDLPWIFKEMLDFMNFVFAHKLESILVAISIFVLFAIMLSSRKAS